MDKNEILERNRRCNKNAEDEREQYINGKAGITAKLVFSLVVVAIVIFKIYKGMPTGDIWCIFMAYISTEYFYKYYYLKDKKILLYGIVFGIISVISFFEFISSTYI